MYVTCRLDKVEASSNLCVWICNHLAYLMYEPDHLMLFWLGEGRPKPRLKSHGAQFNISSHILFFFVVSHWVLQTYVHLSYYNVLTDDIYINYNIITMVS